MPMRPGMRFCPFRRSGRPIRGSGGRPWRSSAALQQLPQADGSSRASMLLLPASGRDGRRTPAPSARGLSRLWLRRFAELSRDIEELQARFEEDPLREYWPIDAADAFASATPELDAALEAWVKATPDSFAPYLARGSHGVALAYARRGAKYMADTPASDVVAMRQSLRAAMAALVNARTLRPKLF